LNSLESAATQELLQAVQETATAATLKIDASEALGRLMDEYVRMYRFLESGESPNRTSLNNLVQRIGFYNTNFGTVSSQMLHVSDRLVDANNYVATWQQYYNTLQSLGPPTQDNQAGINAAQAGINNARNRFNYKMGRIANYTVAIDNSIESVRNYITNTVRPQLDEFVAHSHQLDQLRAAEMEAIRNFINEVNNLPVENEFRRAMEATRGCEHETLRPSDTPKCTNPNCPDRWEIPISQLDIYRGFERFSLGVKAEDFRTAALQYLGQVEEVLASIGFRHANTTAIYHGAPNSPNIPLASLRDANLIRGILGYTNSNSPPPQNPLAQFVSFRGGNDFGQGVGHAMPLGFDSFPDVAARNRELFEFIESLGNMLDGIPGHENIIIDESGPSTESDPEARGRNIISQLGAIIDAARTGLLNVPGGAMRVPTGDPAEPLPPSGTTDENSMRSETRDALGAVNSGGGNNPNFFSVLSNPIGILADYGDLALLLTYGLYFFSNYTTNRGINDPADQHNPRRRPGMSNAALIQRTPTGVPFSPRMNYFYQSEWEYLLFGSNSAAANLRKVTGLIFAIRLAANYITVFKVPAVTAFVKKFWAIPFVGKILGEVVRFLFVMAETTIDTAMLRNGWRVPLIKRPNEWIARPGPQLVRTITHLGMESPPANSHLRGCRGGRPCTRCLSYENYLLAFFLIESIRRGFTSGGAAGYAQVLERRIGDLIQLNMTNFAHNLYRYPNDILPANFFANLHQNLESIIGSDDAEQMLNLAQVHGSDVINVFGGRGARERRMQEIWDTPGQAFDLSRMVTTFEIETIAEVDMIFLRMPFAQRGIRGVVPPSVWKVSVVDRRGY